METKIKTKQEMPWVPMGKLRKFVKNNEVLSDDAHITFEFLMLMCFPTIYETINQYTKDCYTQGYIQGLKANSEEKDNDKS